MTLTSTWIGIARVALGCAALAFAAQARASAPGFCDGLSPEEKAICGIANLTAEQATSLDAFVSRDVTLAHQGGITGFSTAFSARHSGRDLKAAGLDRLTPKELAALDVFAARAIALGPPPEQSFAYSPQQPPPKPPPVPTETVVSDLARTQVHGDVSFTLGGGSHGQNFYGTSADLFVTDPTGRFTVGVGFDDYRGRGLLSLYGPNGPYGPYGPYGPVYGGPPYLWDWTR
jgi:hypothetical protein